MLRLEQRFDAARLVLDAAVVLPDAPEVRSWAVDARRLFVDLRAQPYLEKLDAALGTAPAAQAGASPSEERAARVGS
jgi:hypothetical protein